MAVLMLFVCILSFVVFGVALYNDFKHDPTQDREWWWNKWTRVDSED